MTYRGRDPPHGENGLYVERKDCPYREKKTLGKPPSPHMEFYLIRAHTPLASAYSSPLHAPIMISTHFIPMFERVRKKINKNKIFLALSLNFFWGGVTIVSNNPFIAVLLQPSYATRHFKRSFQSLFTMIK